MCTQCTATPNRLGLSTVSASTEALVTTTQEQSKRGTCKRAKWPERKLSKKKDTQKMSKGSAMSTEHNLCDSTSRGASDAVGNAIAGSPNGNNALQRTVMPPLFSAQYGPRDPSQDAFSLLKYMPWKGNLCKSKVAWAVTSLTRSSSNLAAAVAIEVPTIPNGTCLGSTQTWLVDNGVGRHLQWYCAWLPEKFIVFSALCFCFSCCLLLL